MVNCFTVNFRGHQQYGGVRELSLHLFTQSQVAFVS